MTTIRLENLRKTLGGREIIRGIDLAIAPREFVVFVGPSGSGKSTLLRLIAGLEDITEGKLYIGEECVNDVPPAGRNIAMVFQSYALYPHMTVYENMAFGLKRARLGRQEIEQRIARTADMLDITPYLSYKPAQLSGGQRQRVAIGRAIVRQPKIFLFDEPLSNLDASLRVQTRVEIARLHQEMQTTMIYVTHDQVEAMTLADRIVLLNGGQIEQTGTPMELYHRPRNLFVAKFIGSPAMNTLRAMIVGVTGQGVTVTLPEGSTLTLPLAPPRNLHEGEALTLGIRPEHLVVVPPGEGMQARIELVEALGSENYLHVSLPGKIALILRVPGDSTFSEGETVSLALPPEYCHAFDASGDALPRLA